MHDVNALTVLIRALILWCIRVSIIYFIFILLLFLTPLIFFF